MVPKLQRGSFARRQFVRLIAKQKVLLLWSNFAPVHQFFSKEQLQKVDMVERAKHFL